MGTGEENIIVSVYDIINKNLAKKIAKLLNLA